MGDKIKALFRSRRFYAALAIPIVVIAKDVLGFDVSPELVMSGLVALSMWILGDSLRHTE